MRKLFENLSDDLAQFIEQRDHMAMVIRCQDFESAYILKSLQGIDDANTSDIFWMFADEFIDTDAYIATIVEHFKKKHQAVCEALIKDHKRPWPGLPADILDHSLSPVTRLKNTMKFSRHLLPNLDGHLVVWAFFPYQISNTKEFSKFFVELLRHEFPIPWCHHMRMFFRDDAQSPILQDSYINKERIAWIQPDLSPQAMVKSLEKELEDKEIPLPQRVQSLLVLAGLDLSNGRHADALYKYQFLLRYYQTNGDMEMSALVLNWIGEIFEHSGNQTEALNYFESALTPAIESKSNPILLNIALNLANLKLAQNSWHESEVYYDSVEKIATALLIPQVKIQALENKGVCHYMLGNKDDAVNCWENGATLAKSMEENYLLKNILKRLYDHYELNGPKKKQDEVNRKLAAIRTE